PVVLLHGAGADASAWDAIGPPLARRYRVVAPDLRGHGQSGDGPWDFDAVLDDIEAVVEHCGLSNPVVVGQSLGGMLAGMWGRRHPECPALVSLDGHRATETDPGNYHGIAADERDAILAELKGVFDAHEAASGRPLPEEAIAATSPRARVVRDGHTYRRPGPELTAALRAAPEFHDSVPIFAEVGCPFLVVLATRNLPGIPPHFDAFMDAFRQGLRDDLGAIHKQRSTLVVHEVDASHNLTNEIGEQLVAEITRFIDESLGTVAE
ncbi:MAG TPA: alpha/beta hydrolase, partial [Stackebrandtia sp.]|uniref:alpha/beta fold hydrolase n=1 Tax=Stackebrandtia sp. TaxID=2023065 RepID=UPI002D59F0FA